MPEISHYDLTLTLGRGAGDLEVRGRAKFAPAPSGGANSATTSFLLNPALEPLNPPEFAPKQRELRFHYRGRLSEGVSPEASELTAHNLWYPVFSDRPPPFTFRLLLSVPPEVLPAVSGRLVPLPPELATRAHDHEAARTYLWESIRPGRDIAVAVGPYLVHQRLMATAPGPPPNLLSAEVFVLDEDYDLGEIILGRMERILGLLRPRPGPAGSYNRLGVVVPPVSHWGIYSRPGHIVIPRPMASKLRDPGKGKTVALVLAHEMASLLGETGHR